MSLEPQLNDATASALASKSITIPRLGRFDVSIMLANLPNEFSDQMILQSMISEYKPCEKSLKSLAKKYRELEDIADRELNLGI